jgi:hypothetical protein
MTTDADVRPHYLQTAYDAMIDIADLNELTTPELKSLIRVLDPARCRALWRRAAQEEKNRPPMAGVVYLDFTKSRNRKSRQRV